MPGCTGVEDEMHAIFECKGYDHLRLDLRFKCLFGNVTNDKNKDMWNLFSCGNQQKLAALISCMAIHRKGTRHNSGLR